MSISDQLKRILNSNKYRVENFQREYEKGLKEWAESQNPKLEKPEDDLKDWRTKKLESIPLNKDLDPLNKPSYTAAEWSEMITNAFLSRKYKTLKKQVKREDRKSTYKMSESKKSKGGTGVVFTENGHVGVSRVRRPLEDGRTSDRAESFKNTPINKFKRYVRIILAEVMLESRDDLKDIAEFYGFQPDMYGNYRLLDRSLDPTEWYDRLKGKDESIVELESIFNRILKRIKGDNPLKKWNDTWNNKPGSWFSPDESMLFELIQQNEELIDLRLSELAMYYDNGVFVCPINRPILKGRYSEEIVKDFDVDLSKSVAALNESYINGVINLKEYKRLITKEYQFYGKEIDHRALPLKEVRKWITFAEFLRELKYAESAGVELDFRFVKGEF